MAVNKVTVTIHSAICQTCLMCVSYYTDTLKMLLRVVCLLADSVYEVGIKRGFHKYGKGMRAGRPAKRRHTVPSEN